MRNTHILMLAASQKIKQMKLTTCLFIGTILSTTCFGQTQVYTGKASLERTLNSKSLLDSKTGTKFILDSTNIFITAINIAGDTTWRTDPWKDSKLESYRVNRPIVVSMDFANNKQTNNKERIWIVYNNSQFGTLDKETGKFTWFGQD